MNPFVSKWFHEVWDGEHSVVLSAHMRRADFSGCDVDPHVDARELPEAEQRTAIGVYTMHVNLLEAIRTDGDTICNVHDGVKSVSICNALEAAVRTGKPQAVRTVKAKVILSPPASRPHAGLDHRGPESRRTSG